MWYDIIHKVIDLLKYLRKFHECCSVFTKVREFPLTNKPFFFKIKFKMYYKNIEKKDYFHLLFNQILYIVITIFYILLQI